MKALISGGAGFIGSHITDEILRRGYSARILDNFSTGRRTNIQHLDGIAEIFEGDLRSYHLVYEAVQGCDVIFHQGALPSVPRSVKDPITTDEVNVLGTLHILQAARDCGVKRVVIASSSSIYGSNPALPKVETMTPQPKSPYAVSKLAGEHYAQVFHQLYGLETVCLRYFNVFGSRQDPTSQYSAVIPKFINAILNKRPITVFGDGSQSRDFTYIDNVVSANLLASETEGIGGAVFNVGLHQQISLNEMIEALFKILNSETEVIYNTERMGDVKHSCADNNKIVECLGFKTVIPFEEGLRRTVESFLKER